MGSEDQNDIIDKVKNAGKKDNDEPSNDKPLTSDETELEELHVYENMDNLFVNPKKNNMFQEGSNDILDEIKPCWKGYKQIGTKSKDGKEVPNCVPVNENLNSSDSLNYMFWQNLKTIHHASSELLKMNKAEIDNMCSNGHAWAVDHISSSADDIEEVYHFFETNIKSEEYDGDTTGGYHDEYGNVEDVSMNEAEYKGKSVTLGKPMKGDVKKFKVFVKNKSGNVIKVNFGDPDMEIKRDDPERRKSFRARHKCSQAKDRTTPKYWSCRMWSKTPVSKIMSEDISNDSISENLSELDKNSIFDKNYFRMKLKESFNQEDTIETEPIVKPTPVIEPNKKPSRRDKPFLPMPNVNPDPKANK